MLIDAPGSYGHARFGMISLGISQTRMNIKHFQKKYNEFSIIGVVIGFIVDAGDGEMCKKGYSFVSVML